MKIENGKLKINRGFTLIELLIVIAIIGILATILLTVLDPLGQRRKAIEAKAVSETYRIAEAIEACGVQTGDYAKCNTSSKLSTEGFNISISLPGGSSTSGVAYKVCDPGTTDFTLEGEFTVGGTTKRAKYTHSAGEVSVQTGDVCK